MPESTTTSEMFLALRECAEGRLPANIALMQLLSAASDEAWGRRALDEALVTADEGNSRQRLRAVEQLWDAKPGAYRLVKTVLQTATCSVRENEWARTFDEAATISPEAAVALYSFGDERLLAAATEELVSRLGEWRLLQSPFMVLDFGCGIGRVSAALAPKVVSVFAVDVSPRMAKLARDRLAGCNHALALQCDGRSLSFLRTGCFDTVLAIDSFPYLVESGTAEELFREALRVLRPQGRLLIMNYSYRREANADTAEVLRLGSRYGAAVERHGTRDLSLWDGRAFLLRKY